MSLVRDVVPYDPLGRLIEVSWNNDKQLALRCVDGTAIYELLDNESSVEELIQYLTRRWPAEASWEERAKLELPSAFPKHK